MLGFKQIEKNAINNIQPKTERFGDRESVSDTYSNVKYSTPLQQNPSNASLVG